MAAGLVMGAAVAFGYVVTGGTVAWPAEAKAPPSTTKPTVTSSVPPPPPPPILPFNAKLTSQNIPIAGGGVRSGACSGALVAPSWVVTAGHCFHDLKDARI